MLKLEHKEDGVDLKRRLDLKKVFIALYVVVFLVYLVIGLQPAGAVDLDISTEIAIPAIGLNSDVATLKLENGKLNTPDTIVGRYSQNENNTLLIGHSSTVFRDLKYIGVGDAISYDLMDYEVASIEVFEKKDIDMDEVLSARDEETIIIMTCAGENLEGGDATHRLIVTAVKK